MKLLAVCAVALAVVAIVLVARLGGAPERSAASPAAIGASDWPMYLHDEWRSAANPGESTLGPENAGALTKLWQYDTGGWIVAAPAVVDGVVYVGSWDGWMYALGASDGSLIWKTYLGVTVYPTCFPSAGITSSAAVANGVVYVGGGDDYLYALDAATGVILWQVDVSGTSPAGGNYNYSSPLVYNGHVYVGTSGFCDNPHGQGRLLKISLNSHQIVDEFKVVPDGQIGGGIWTSPSVDSLTNTIYVTTGDGPDPSQTIAESLIALDADTLDMIGYWRVPLPDQPGDPDWGNSPILFDLPTGEQLVAATNKNGRVYAFDRSDVSAGPVWQRQIAVSGDCPQCGQGSASSGTIGSGLLYMAGGNTTVGCVSASGSVRALDPLTGAVVWEHRAAGVVVAALSSANGLVFAAAGARLNVLDGSTGARLYSYQTGGETWGPPVVANGVIYMGSNDSYVYAFGPASVTATVTPAPTATSACTATPTPTDTPTVTPTPVPSPDTDGDGCTDLEESGSDPELGGMRDISNQWDFYDVNATRKVDAIDIALVRGAFNGGGPTPPEDEIYDRSEGVYPWAPGAPDGAIGALDIGLVRISFNHNCQGPP